MGSAHVFVRGPPKAVDDVARSLFQDRNGCLCIDVGLIPQPEGDAVPDKQKLAIIVGDRTWIRYPPVQASTWVAVSFYYPSFPQIPTALLYSTHCLTGGGWSLDVMFFLLRATNKLADPLGRPVVIEGVGPVGAAHFMGWMPGPIPVVSLGGVGSLVDLEHLFTNGLIDPKPRDSSQEDLDVTADMLARMEPTWLFVRNQTLIQQKTEQMNRYQDQIQKLKNTVSAREATIKKLRDDSKDLQSQLAQGVSDEQAVSRRKDISNQQWARLGRALVNTYDPEAAAADRPPADLPVQLRSGNVTYPPRIPCPHTPHANLPPASDEAATDLSSAGRRDRTSSAVCRAKAKYTGLPNVDVFLL